MEYHDAKEKFLSLWGTLSDSWGISKTMGQVHALLLISPQSMSTEEVMNKLSISRGNAHLNLKALMDWGLIYCEMKPGDRKDFYYAEKDTWEIFRKIVIQRKKKELDPVVKLFDEIASVKEDCEESKEFCKMVSELRLMSNQADSMLDKILKTDPNWLTKGMLAMLK